MTKTRKFVHLIRNPAWICFLWFGLVVGVSMLATPVRFSAESITRPVALDVGRVVFAALNKAEIVALIVLLIIMRVSPQAKRLWAFGFTLALIVLVQAIWLIPELAARTDLILQGIEPPPSIAHAAYSILELAKLGLLAWLGFRSLALLAEDASRLS